MPLLRNPYQPFFPDPNSPANRACSGTYCYPFILGDDLHQQWYQTPCAGSLVVDPEFTDVTLGAELVTNGTFTGSAAGWTLDAGWSYSANSISVAAAGTPTAYQTGLGLAAGTTYRVTVDVTIAQGELVVILGVGAGSYTSPGMGVSGSYSFDIPYQDTDDQITFEPSQLFTMATVDNVSVKAITYNDWDVNTVWSLSDAKACKTITGTGNLVNGTTDYMTSGEYYYVVVTVSSYTDGQVQVYVDDGAGAESNLQTAIIANGTYEYWITPSQTGQIAFKPDSDFIGCISSPEVYLLRNDYSGDLVANSDDTHYDITAYFEYYQDKVTLNSDLFSLLELPYGCYHLEIYDACLISGNELMTNGDFGAGSTGWTETNYPGQYSYPANNVQFDFDPREGANIITNGDFSAGAAGWTVGAGWAIGASAVHTPGNTAVLSRSVTIATPATPPAFSFTWIQITVSGRTAGSFTVTLSDKTSGVYSTDGTFIFRLIPTIGGGAVTFSINPSTDFDGTIDDIEIYETPNNWQQSPFLYNAANPDIVSGNYQMTFEIVSITGSGFIGMAGGILSMTQSLVPETALGVHTVNINGYEPGWQIPYLIPYFGEVDPYGGTRSYVGSIVIDNVTLVRVEPFEATYTSECLNYQLTHPNTKLVTGECDQDAFGFTFTNAGFHLQMRIEVRSIAPVYPKGKQIAKYGTGNARVTYSESEKYWQLHTGLLDESAHDALAIMIDCDDFKIGDSQTNSVAYVAEPDDYSPNWNTSGSYDLATSVINLRVADNGMVFNRHT